MIRVGAASEAELKSRKEAFDDAISATKAAMAEGIVPGGGLALLRAIDAVAKKKGMCDGDERTGLLILAGARGADPADCRKLSCGRWSGRRPDAAGNGNYGFDAARGEYVDLVEAGIIDPTKVVRVALENAVSVARVLLFTEATLTEVPRKKKLMAAQWNLQWNNSFNVQKERKNMKVEDVMT